MQTPDDTTEAPARPRTTDQATSAAEEHAAAPLAADAIDAEALDDAGHAPLQEASPPEPGPTERQRIKEQLEALKRRESELRRALAIAEHPDLAEAIRVLEGRTYAVAKAQEKLAQGLSKSEERRRETLERKVATLRDKRGELDGQIAALDTELAALGVDRTRAHEAERRTALEHLLAALGTHGDALAAAGLEPGQLVPELEAWLPEVRALAESLTGGSARPVAEA